jgi:hypothetical protein
MKYLSSLIVVAALLTLGTGCATNSDNSRTQATPIVVTRSVDITHPEPNAAVLQAAKDVAQQLNLPAATLTDNDSGLVSFYSNALSTSIQVTIVGGKAVQITVCNPPAAGQDATVQLAQNFASQLDAKLQTL